MSWEFEQSFSGSVQTTDPGTPSVDQNGKTTYPSGQSDYTDFTAVWSGRDLWVFSTNTKWQELRVYNLWDHANKDYEKLTFNYYFDNGTHPIRDVYKRTYHETTGIIDRALYHSATSAKVYAGKWYDKMYVSHGPKDIIVWDIKTGKPTGQILTLPLFVLAPSILCDGPKENVYQLTVGSNICCANNKLFVSTYTPTIDGTDQQYLCIYDIGAGTWTQTPLPGRAQTQDRHIVDGLDGYVWITNKNNHSIIKVDIATNAITTTIRINRHPYKLLINQSKEMFIASDAGDTTNRKFYDPEKTGGTVATSVGFLTAPEGSWTPVATTDTTDGMISAVDQIANTQEAYAAARCNGSTKDKEFHDDGQGYLWFVTDNHIGRLKKSDKELKTSYTKVPVTSDQPPEFEMIPDNSEIAFTWAGNALCAIMSPAFYYQRWNGASFDDVNVKPYLYIVAKEGIAAIRCTALVRKNKYIHRGTAMIAIGDQAYYGD